MGGKPKRTVTWAFLTVHRRPQYGKDQDVRWVGHPYRGERFSSALEAFENGGDTCTACKIEETKDGGRVVVGIVDARETLVIFAKWCAMQVSGNKHGGKYAHESADHSHAAAMDTHARYATAIGTRQAADHARRSEYFRVKESYGMNSGVDDGVFRPHAHHAIREADRAESEMWDAQNQKLTDLLEEAISNYGDPPPKPEWL